MKTAQTRSCRPRAEIIASIAGLSSSIQGTISEDKRVLANGTTAVYHNLQYWEGGKNHTIRIPADKVAQFKEAVKNGKTAKSLLLELSRADASEILSAPSPLKKTSRTSSSRARRGSTRS